LAPRSRSSFLTTCDTADGETWNSRAARDRFKCLAAVLKTSSHWNLAIAVPLSRLFTASRGFTYDDLNRMIAASGTFGVNQATQNCTYTYSAIGNLTNKCGAVLSYGDANHPSAVTNHSSLKKNYSYDQNGNMLTRGNQTLAWTVDNRVASVAISGGGTTLMEYDYSGMRVKKSAPAGITLYPFQGYEIAPNGVVSKFIRVGGESIALKKGIYKYFYHNDHLGSANVITDATGVRVQTLEYDPWGTVSRASGPTIDPDTRFTGQKLDPETGLYFYNGRYYDAEIGRFISADPFVQAPYDPQNLNRYSYVINNPQNYVDPDGYFHIHKKKKKTNWFSRIFGGIIGAFVFILTGDPTLALVMTNTFTSAMNGDVRGAIMAMTSPVAYGFGGLVGGSIYQGIYSETNGGSFGKAFWKSFINTRFSYDYANSSTGGGVGNDYPGSFQVACSFCWGLFIGSAEAAQRRPGHPDLMESGGNSGGGGGLRGVYVTPAPSAGHPSISSRTPPLNGSSMTVNQALTEGAKWVGQGYKEIGPGVFRSADGLHQFRMTTSDILGRHGNRVPHVNFELFNSPLDKVPAINSHILLKGPGIGGGFP